MERMWTGAGGRAQVGRACVFLLASQLVTPTADASAQWLAREYAVPGYFLALSHTLFWSCHGHLTLPLYPFRSTVAIRRLAHCARLFVARCPFFSPALNAQSLFSRDHGLVTGVTSTLSCIYDAAASGELCYTCQFVSCF
ncbi:hypothetical protein HDK64DRAFT_9604 [Phyllosticta capitalensis]